MTTRAQLQSKQIDSLPESATAVGVEADGLQNSKLISALMESGQVEVTAETATADETVDLPKATPRAENPAAKESAGSDSDGGRERSDHNRRQQGGQRNRRRRGGGGGQREDFIPEEDLEVREGLLDILPEGYGFLRVSGYLPSEKDVYVSANQVRKFRLRKGDIVSGPIRPPRSKEKFPAVVRIAKVNGIDPEEAMKRPKFESLTPLFPDERLKLEVEGRKDGILTRIIDLIAPIGKGQRGLVVSPPKAGKTTVLQEIARAVTINNPDNDCEEIPSDLLMRRRETKLRQLFISQLRKILVIMLKNHFYVSSKNF